MIYIDVCVRPESPSACFTFCVGEQRLVNRSAEAEPFSQIDYGFFNRINLCLTERLEIAAIHPHYIHRDRRPFILIDFP